MSSSAGSNETPQISHRSEPVGSQEPHQQDEARVRVPPELPTFYADQIVDILYGVSTSKLVFGVETGNGVTATHVIVLPTAALTSSANTIVTNMSDAGMVQETAARFTTILNFMRSLHVPSRRFNADENTEVTAPAKELGTTVTELKAAVAKVSPNKDAVKKQVARPKKSAN